MSNIDKKLQLVFNTANEKTHTIVIDTPVEPADPTLVKLFMDTMIADNAINGRNGQAVSIKGAYFVTRTVQEVPLV